MWLKSLIFLTLALLTQFAQADNAITFSPALPKPWTQVSSQTAQGTNPLSQSPLIAHLTVVQNTTNQQSMMISVIPLTSADATNHLADDAKNWLQSVLNGIRENHAAEISKFDVKTEKKQQVVETAFSIRLQDTVLCGISRYTIVKTNAIAWVAFGEDPSIETNKTVFGIAGSIRVRK